MIAPGLIVGAGPTGLTLAIECQRRGIPFRLIEKKEKRESFSKALALWCGTLELFEAIGVVDKFYQKGIAVPRIHFADKSFSVANIDLAEGIESDYPCPVLLPQYATESILEERLKELGGSVEYGKELAAFNEENGTINARIASGGSEDNSPFGWLAGCDGANSIVRRSLKIDFEGYTEEALFILCDVKVVEGLQPATINISWGNSHTVACFPIEGDLWRIMTKRFDLADSSTPAWEEFEEALADAAPQIVTEGAPSWSSCFRVNERVATHFSHKRTFLLGDAAHIHSPAGGQGMNTGIQDAYNLGWKLSHLLKHNADGDAVIGSYTLERKPVAINVVKGAANKIRLAMHNNTFLRLFKDVAFNIVKNIGPLRRHIVYTLSELDIHYTQSPLVNETLPWHGNDSGIIPGMKVRDAIVIDPSNGNSESKLWAKLLSIHYTLMTFSGTKAVAPTELLERLHLFAKEHELNYLHVAAMHPPDNAAYTTVWDRDLAAHDRYGVKEASWYLVRPDQYVAARSNIANVAALQDHVLESMKIAQETKVT